MAATNLGDRIAVLVEAFNRRRFSEYTAAFRDDAVIEYPQSGERVDGRKNLLAMLEAFATPPTFHPWRIDADGDTVVLHAEGRYPGFDPLFVLIEFQFDGALIVRETAYFAGTFAPAEWRRPFVRVESFISA